MGDLVERGSTAPRIGAWDHPLADPNLEDARIAHAFDQYADTPGLAVAERLYRKKFRLKSWQYMTAVTDELFIAFVIGTAGYASNGFVYAAELPGGTKHEKFAIVPFTLGCSVAPSSAAGSHRFTAPGLAITIDNLDGGRRFAVRIAATTATGGRLTAELAYSTVPTDEHLALCVPIGEGRWNYTHKYAGFAVTGHVMLDGRRVDFAPGTSFGTLDFTKMYAKRHAVWRWIALAGKTTRGAVIGMNIVDPTPDAAVSENALWIDGKRSAIAEVHLHVEQPTASDSPWLVEAPTLDVTMRSVTYVEQHLDLPLVKNHLRHTVGAFSGMVRTASGQIHDLEHVIGIAEDYDTWW